MSGVTNGALISKVQGIIDNIDANFVAYNDGFNNIYSRYKDNLNSHDELDKILDEIILYIDITFNRSLALEGDKLENKGYLTKIEELLAEVKGHEVEYEKLAAHQEKLLATNKVLRKFLILYLILLLEIKSKKGKTLLSVIIDYADINEAFLTSSATSINLHPATLRKMRSNHSSASKLNELWAELKAKDLALESNDIDLSKLLSILISTLENHLIALNFERKHSEQTNKAKEIYDQKYSIIKGQIEKLKKIDEYFKQEQQCSQELELFPSLEVYTSLLAAEDKAKERFNNVQREKEAELKKRQEKHLELQAKKQATRAQSNIKTKQQDLHTPQAPQLIALLNMAQTVSVENINDLTTLIKICKKVKEQQKEPGWKITDEQKSKLFTSLFAAFKTITWGSNGTDVLNIINLIKSGLAISSLDKATDEFSSANVLASLYEIYSSILLSKYRSHAHNLVTLVKKPKSKVNSIVEYYNESTGELEYYQANSKMTMQQLKTRFSLKADIEMLAAALRAYLDETSMQLALHLNEAPEYRLPIDVEFNNEMCRKNLIQLEFILKEYEKQDQLFITLRMNFQKSFVSPKKARSELSEREKVWRYFCKEGGLPQKNRSHKISEEIVPIKQSESFSIEEEDGSFPPLPTRENANSIATETREESEKTNFTMPRNRSDSAPSLLESTPYAEHTPETMYQSSINGKGANGDPHNKILRRSASVHGNLETTKYAKKTDQEKLQEILNKFNQLKKEGKIQNPTIPELPSQVTKDEKNKPKTNI